MAAIQVGFPLNQLEDKKFLSFMRVLFRNGQAKWGNPIWCPFSLAFFIGGRLKTMELMRFPIELT